MADRYWVGGTDNWDGTAGTKWATTSGGAGGASVPTNSDNVFLDAASGTVTVTIATTALCLDLNCAGFTGTLAGSQPMNIRGSLFFSTTMTRTNSGSKTFSATTTGKTITNNGKGLGGTFTFFNGNGGEWILQDDISFNTLQFSTGTLNTNGKAVSVGPTGSLTIAAAGTKVLTLGSSVITLSGSGLNASTATNLTVNAGTSTIILSNISPTFAGNGQTYNNVELTGSTGGGTFNISGNNTFNSFTISRTAAVTVKFTDGTTNTATNWAIAGTPGNVITLTNTASTTQATLIKAGGGSVTVDYANISWINATPSFTWFATNSTDSGNNTGLTFGVVYALTANNGNYAVTGYSATILKRLYWEPIDNTQAANWSDINNTQALGWSGINNLQVPGWTPIIGEPVPSWGIIDDTQTPNWQQISTV